MTTRLAVFDLDGTLVDTAPDLIETANHVLKARGITPVPGEVMRRFIGLGAQAMIESALRAHNTDLGSVDLEALKVEFVAHYQTRIAKLSYPFEEITAALPVLQSAGVVLAVCTNKREALARMLLDELQLMDKFVALTGGDSFAFAKPDPRHLTETVTLAGGTPEATVFVGDSRVDFETARNAKLPLVGLSYGYSDVPMVDLKPDRLCMPGDDIAAAILDLLP